jgi:hypothetical protein
MKRLIVVIALLIVTACTRKQESETLATPPPTPVVPAETVVAPPPASAIPAETVVVPLPASAVPGETVAAPPFTPAVPDIEEASDYFNVVFGNLSFRLPYACDFAYYNGIDDVYGRVTRDNNSMSLHVSIFDVYNFPDGPGFFSQSRYLELAEYIAGRISRLDRFGSHRPYRLRSFNNIKAADIVILGEYSFDDIQFSRLIVFFDDKYCYSISLRINGNDIDKILPRELPEYFIVDGRGVYWSDEALEEISYKFNNNEALPEYLQEMIEKGDIIFRTMYLN